MNNNNSYRPAHSYTCSACNSNGIDHKLKDGSDVVVCPQCPNEKKPGFPKVIDWRGKVFKQPQYQQQQPQSYNNNNNNSQPVWVPPMPQQMPSYSPQSSQQQQVPRAPLKRRFGADEPIRPVEESRVTPGETAILNKLQELLDAVMQKEQPLKEIRDLLAELASREDLTQCRDEILDATAKIDKTVHGIAYEIGTTKDDSN